MGVRSFELFKKGEGTWGLVLYSTWAFGELNRYFKRYPQDTLMKKGEEPLFWVTEKDKKFVEKVLSVPGWPNA